MVYGKSPAMEDEENLKGEGDQIRFLVSDLKEEKLQDYGKEEEGTTFHRLNVLRIKNDCWDRVRGLGCEIWKGCERSGFCWF